MLEYPLLLVFPIAMAFAAAFDLFTMTIPNKISIALLAAFLVVAPLSGMPIQLIGVHLATGFAVLVAGFVLFTVGGVGGGDAKLVAAAALWIGYDSLLKFLLMIGVWGGVLALGILMFRRMVPEAWISSPAWLARLHDRKTGIPYGLAISAAALMLYPHTRWFTHLFA